MKQKIIMTLTNKSVREFIESAINRDSPVHYKKNERGKKTMRNLDKLAKRGYQAAFSRKSNSSKYKRLLSRYGYKSSMLRSSGPTIDSKKKRTVHAYYIIPIKKRGGSDTRRRVTSQRNLWAYKKKRSSPRRRVIRQSNPWTFNPSIGSMGI